jgi:serine/threonine protein phosphatase PrpC
MGTTVVAARVTGNRFEVAWVGDSRVYLWREGQLAQLSQDHSYVQELIAQGAISAEQARSHPHRNVVTQALGVTDPRNLNVETMTGELRPACSCCCAATASPRKWTTQHRRVLGTTTAARRNAWTRWSPRPWMAAARTT